ncbi:MAG TPA: hypothetical protein VLI04_12995 [Nocardioidaceae bacterium]|nr:hypothetical protein [Nocardioidaceae bacterium]
MILARRIGATWLILLACCACDRAEPDAAFRDLTEPFREMAAHCWPFAGEPPFTTPWFADGFTVAAPNASLDVEIFEATAEQVTTQLAAFPEAIATPADGDGPVRVTITTLLDVDAMTAACSP